MPSIAKVLVLELLLLLVMALEPPFADNEVPFNVCPAAAAAAIANVAASPLAEDVSFNRLR